MADLLVRELLDAGIVGRETPKYDTCPGSIADGTHTVRITADHFVLPSPPLGRTGQPAQLPPLAVDDPRNLLSCV
ncbi:hypothetical protein ACIQZB_07475 [Streptomyces sp. NPDC097727]|uniref:hypothetical protein n=1 Tax=Streptomyces sp. NPDC097727 TaxID=3366092 RepID=UPI00380F2C3D